MNDDNFKKLVQDSLETLKKDLKEVKDVQEQRVLPSVSYIETTVKVYADMYKKNKSDARKLEKRIEPLEDKAGIAPPPELTLADVD